MSERISAKNLKLGDIIQCWESGGPWNTGIVRQVTDTEVTIFRPYGQAADFSYTGGVICYTGTEDYKIYRNELEYLVYRRQELK